MDEQERAPAPLGRAAASGFLCGVCDTPLLVGANECVECGTPVAWEAETGGPSSDVTEDDAPASKAAAPSALPPLGSASEGASDGVTFRAGLSSPSDGSKRTTALLVGVAALVIVLVIGALVLKSKGGSSDTPAAAPTTLAAAPSVSTVPVAVAPTTRGAVASTVAPTTAAATVTTIDTKAELCAAVKVYSIADLLALGKHIVTDPPGFLTAYETLLKDAPPELQADIVTMGPLTRTAVAAVQAGTVTTEEAMQAWLTNAPRADLETWVAAQQKVAPILTTTCAGT